MIRFTDELADIEPRMLTGFFEGWPNPPRPETHLRILAAASHVVLAIDDESDRVAGFINAISDGVLSAYIPLLEVLPDYRGRGIGSELTRRMLDQLQHLYMVDLICMPDVQPFYERAGMRLAHGMVARNYANQAGG